MRDSSKEQARRRYPGVRSFEEHDEIQFFGRQRAAEELLLRVLSVRLLLQFAPSGVGKTSLLNAGLFPKLSPHDYFPFIVRLNQANESLTAAVWRSLHEAAVKRGLKDPIVPSEARSVWELLAGAQLWSHDLRLQTPILVFDQFEEIFTLRDEAFRRQFAAEIGELSRGIPRQAAGGESASVPPPAVKIIISLREEYLGKLEEFSNSIPELFHERLRLPPLTTGEARDAIVEPARLAGDWVSPAFAFDSAGADALIDFIDGASERARVIEPLTLQLVCQQAEAIATGRHEDSTICPVLAFDDFGGVAGLERLVQNYFTSALAKLRDRGTEGRARELFEVGLVDPAGKRLMREQDEIKRKYGLTDADLDILVDSRLLRREPRNESIFYEISHDRLTETIAKNRKARLPRWVKPTIAAGAAFIVVLGAVGAVAFYQWHQADTARNMAVAATIEAVNQKDLAESERTRAESALQLVLGEDLVSRLREGGQSESLRRVLDKADISESSKTFALALKLRHQGDILRDRDTLPNARTKYGQALATLEGVNANGGIKDTELAAEHARTLSRAGSLAMDAGKVTDAEEAYARSVRFWDGVTKSGPLAGYAFDAAETHLELGSLRARTGDLAKAEHEFVEALKITQTTLNFVYDRTQGGAHESMFELGRATQIYADAALRLATLYDASHVSVKGAYVLAQESLRLRPLSYQARYQVGVASLEQESSVTAPRNGSERDRFAEARSQFEALAKVDPSNRRLQRDLSMLQLRILDTAARCIDRLACKRMPSARALKEAELAALDSLGTLRYLAELDPENRSLQFDIGGTLQLVARLLALSGRASESIVLFEESADIYRKNIIDVRDIENRLMIAALFTDMARVEASRGDRRLASDRVHKALAEIDRLPDGLMVQIARRNTLDDQTRLVALTSQDRKTLQTELARLDARIGEPWNARTDGATRLNNRGVDLQPKRTASVSDADFERFRSALEFHKNAAAVDPFRYVIWTNLRDVYEVVARERPSEASKQPDAVKVGEQRSALSGTLLAAWMASVLSPANETEKSWDDVYQARRRLAQFLQNGAPGDVDQALALATENAREALRHTRARRPSAANLSLLADAYEGLGVMRADTNNAGWMEALQIAIDYRRQLVKAEPNNPKRRFDLATVHLTNHYYLSSEDGMELADQEYRRAIAVCRNAIRVSGKSRAQHTGEWCLEELDKLDAKPN